MLHLVLIWLDNPTAKSDAIQSITVDRDQGQLAPGAIANNGGDGKFLVDGAMLENSSISLTLSAPANAALGHALTVDYLQATCTLDQWSTQPYNKVYGRVMQIKKYNKVSIALGHCIK
ncbi:hypothetical protein T11_4416 [Trichinella zimbabwensis]|uniref:Uncharacterized protein n=1 Tax=Trichinella zimbabwensis TaxID=268475 RepID=A0A0V1HX23_9BILA|nr:hypothetical protein T11_4416 [Trichinella zimbabwensis]